VTEEPIQPDDPQRKRDQRLFGVYVGVVLDNQDPLQRGRVLVRVPAVDGGKGRGQWAPVTVARAGTQRGTWLIPDVDDEILIAFEAGDAARPYVIGSLWGSANTPPEQMAPGNPVMSIVSAGGSRVTVDDRPEQLSIRLVTPGGQSVTLADAGGTITIDGAGGRIAITPVGIEIQAAGAVRLTAPTAEIRAASLELNCMTRANGTVQCDTLVANSVIASSYSRGAGNLL